MRFGRIAADPGFALLAVSVWLIAGRDFALALLLAVTVHELGHLLFLYCLGGRLNLLQLGLTGCTIYHSGLGYGGEALCASAGPLFSITAAYAAAGLEHELFAGVSLVLGAFNLLPLSFLDGGRVIYCIVRYYLEVDITLAIARIDCILLALLAAFSTAVLVISGGRAAPLVATAVLILNTNTCKLR